MTKRGNTYEINYSVVRRRSTRAEMMNVGFKRARLRGAQE